MKGEEIIKLIQENKLEHEEIKMAITTLDNGEYLFRSIGSIEIDKEWYHCVYFRREDL